MCNFSRMIKNVLSSLRQRAGPQRICSRQKSIRSGTARDSFSQTPHMRGKVCGQLNAVDLHRITPAYAGKRCGDKVKHCFHEDHPRVCGEKRAEFIFSSALVGSPPHVRGKDYVAHPCKRFVGITPACAGKRCSPVIRQTKKRDHPRVCGEKAVATILWYSWIGSPPRMRGKDQAEIRQRR